MKKCATLMMVVYFGLSVGNTGEGEKIYEVYEALPDNDPVIARRVEKLPLRKASLRDKHTFVHDPILLFIPI